MTRPLRIEYPGAWYHVMNRGRRSEDIFIDKKDYLSFIDLLKESIEIWDIKISAYCLMGNHYHLAFANSQWQSFKGNATHQQYLPKDSIKNMDWMGRFSEDDINPYLCTMTWTLLIYGNCAKWD